MAILAQDSFNRADSTTLGNAETGQAWQMLGTIVMGVSSNQAYASTTANNAGAVVDAANTDVKISMNVTANAGEPGILFRVVDGNNHIRAVRSTTTLYIQRRLNGSITTLANKSVGAYTPSEKHTVITKSNGVIEYYLNDVLQLSTTDTNFVTSTKHGIGFATANASTRFDNFLVEDLNTGTPTTQDGTASVIGTGTLSATATKIQNALASMVGTGTLIASPVIIKNGQTSVIGQGLLVANADTLSSVVIVDGSANLKGSGLLTADSITLKNGAATLKGQGILTASADTIHIPTTVDGVFSALGTGFLTADGEVIEFIEPEAPAITVDVILEILSNIENSVSLVSEIRTVIDVRSELENKVSLTFNL